MYQSTPTVVYALFTHLRLPYHSHSFTCGGRRQYPLLAAVGYGFIDVVRVYFVVLGIAALIAQTYFAYISACLPFGVREGRLGRNPAQTETARELVPEDSRDRGDQQHWSPEQRALLIEHARDLAEQTIDEDPFGAYTEARHRALVAMLYYAAVRGAEVLRALKKVQRPPSDDWPVFATSHAPSLWAAARDQLEDVDALVEDLGSIDAVLQERDVAPPALTTDGARTVLKRLTEAAEIDVDEGYLQPHGARRGMIGEVYKRDWGEA